MNRGKPRWDDTVREGEHWVHIASGRQSPWLGVHVGGSWGRVYRDETCGGVSGVHGVVNSVLVTEKVEGTQKRMVVDFPAWR